MLFVGSAVSVMFRGLVCRIEARILFLASDLVSLTSTFDSFTSFFGFPFSSSNSWDSNIPSFFFFLAKDRKKFEVNF